MNTEVHYMYRDGSNYKNHHSIVFKGTLEGGESSIEETNRQIEQYCGGGTGSNFIASQVGFPEIFLWETGEYPFSPDDDHCWHEFNYVSLTSNEPDDPRTIQQVIEDFRKASEEGWKEFNPE